MFAELITNLKRNIHFIFRAGAEFQSQVERYPDRSSGKQSEDLFEGTKGFLANDLKKCTGCGICVDLCPVKALSCQTQIDESGRELIEEFDIDLSRCYSCGVCIEVCPEASLQYTPQFEIAGRSTMDLVLKISPSKEVKPVGRIRTYDVRR